MKFILYIFIIFSTTPTLAVKTQIQALCEREFMRRNISPRLSSYLRFVDEETNVYPITIAFKVPSFFKSKETFDKLMAEISPYIENKNAKLRLDEISDDLVIGSITTHTSVKSIYKIAESNTIYWMGFENERLLNNRLLVENSSIYQKNRYSKALQDYLDSHSAEWLKDIKEMTSSFDKEFPLSANSHTRIVLHDVINVYSAGGIDSLLLIFNITRQESIAGGKIKIPSHSQFFAASFFGNYQHGSDVRVKYRFMFSFMKWSSFFEVKKLSVPFIPQFEEEMKRQVITFVKNELKTKLFRLPLSLKYRGDTEGAIFLSDIDAVFLGESPNNNFYNYLVLLPIRYESTQISLPLVVWKKRGIDHFHIRRQLTDAFWDVFISK